MYTNSYNIVELMPLCALIYTGKDEKSDGNLRKA